MTRNHFVSLQSRLTKIIYGLYLGGKVCVTGGHVTSHNQGLSPKEGKQRKESLGMCSYHKWTAL